MDSLDQVIKMKSTAEHENDLELDVILSQALHSLHVFILSIRLL